MTRAEAVRIAKMLRQHRWIDLYEWRDSNKAKEEARIKVIVTLILEAAAPKRKVKR